MFICPQIWTVTSLTYKHQKRIYEFSILKHFFSENDFLPLIPKCSVTSLKIKYGKSQTCFSALWERKLWGKLNKREAKFPLTCSFQKVIRTLTFGDRKQIQQFILFQTSWTGIV